MEIYFSKVLSTYGIPGKSSWYKESNIREEINAFHVFPTIRKYKYEALSNNYYNINALLSLQDQNDSLLIENLNEFIERNYT